MCTNHIAFNHMMKHASMGSAGTAPKGADQQQSDEFENIAQEKHTLLASSPPGRAQESGCGSAAVTNHTGSPDARANDKLASSVDPENVYWQAAIITDKEVALEDHGGDNSATLTRDGAAGMANCSGFGFTNQGTDLIVLGKGGSAHCVQGVYNWWNGRTAGSVHAWVDITIEQTYDRGDCWKCTKLIRKGSSGNRRLGKQGGNRRDLFHRCYRFSRYKGYDFDICKGVRRHCGESQETLERPLACGVFHDARFVYERDMGCSHLGRSILGVLLTLICASDDTTLCPYMCGCADENVSQSWRQPWIPLSISRMLASQNK